MDLLTILVNTFESRHDVDIHLYVSTNGGRTQVDKFLKK